MFRLYTDAQGSFEQFGGDCRHSIKDGLLVIDTDDKRRIYSPQAWTYLETERPKPTVY